MAKAKNKFTIPYTNDKDWFTEGHDEHPWTSLNIPLRQDGEVKIAFSWFVFVAEFYGLW